MGLIAAVLGLSIASSGLLGWLWWRLVHGQGKAAERLLGPADQREELILRLREAAARLKADNDELRRHLQDYQSIAGEGGQRVEAIVVARAQIVARSRREGEALVSVDKGAVDGVRQGMLALAGWSLLGTVVGEAAHQSLVRLITDRESAVPAALYDDGKLLAAGLLVGDGAGACRLLWVEDHPDLLVAPGQEVLTSGSDGILPAGLMLGTVVAAQPRGDSDHWHIRVEPWRQAAASLSVVLADASQAKPGSP